jgi:ATP-dependent RNA helicase MSS116
LRNQALAERQRYDDNGGAQQQEFQEIKKFQQLIDHNLVHPNIVTAITEGMGHETMTDVQTLTINQGLQGTDM